ncbi:MAG TPA: arylesterase, partial [Cellvibrionaceae bacterium]
MNELFRRFFRLFGCIVCVSALVFSPILLASNKPVIVVVGDSLSAGYGIDPREGWVELLQQRLDNTVQPYQVVNASISGDTTTGGQARLGKLLDTHNPTIVVLELGGNDGLRGQPLRIMRSNLESMIVDSKNAGAKVLLLGMQIPPNYGARYTQTFADTFTDLAKKHRIALVPFFLDQVALKA